MNHSMSTKGAIICSRATWYEYGEKGNKYFLSLETHRKSKSCIRKVYPEEGFLTSDPKRIMKEVKGFYSNLYKRDSLEASDDTLNMFLRPQLIPKLSNENATLCENFSNNRPMRSERNLTSQKLLMSSKRNFSFGNGGI